MKATWLLHLYPTPWRRRYEPEFRALLEAQPVSIVDALDIAFGALDAHLRPQDAQLGTATPGAGSPALPDPERIAAARRRLRWLKLFYAHAALFVVVNLVLLGINLLTTPSEPWFLYPVWGWGILLALHAGLTFPWRGLFGAHLATFVATNIGLVAINWTGGGSPWSLWVIAGTAPLMIGHAALAFGLTDLFGAHLIATVLGGGVILAGSRLVSDGDQMLWGIAWLVAPLAGHAYLRTGQSTFYRAHVVTFVIVNALLLVSNLTTERETIWFYYPLIATGILLALHSLVRFRMLGFPDDVWEEGAIERITTQRRLASNDPTVRAQVRRRRGVLAHLFLFGAGALVLIVLNILSSDSTAWSVWPIGVWSVVLAGHLGYVLISPRSLGTHLLGGVAAALGLIAIDATTRGGPWAYWPIAGWIVVLLVHAAAVFKVQRVISAWEHRRLSSLIE